jgi:hypothetical protein
MNIGARLAFPGAIFGSIFVALFGLMVTSNVKAEALPTPFPTPLAASVEQQEAEISSESSETSGMTTEELFEASIAYTPETDSPEPVEVLQAGCKVSDKFPPSILQWCDYVTHYAEKNNLPPDLIAAVIVQESGGQPLAYSHSGAVGLMQVMPRDGIATKFMCKNGPCFTDRPTIAELQEPEFNVAYGTRMLSGLINRFGSYRDGLKSYGPMDVGYSYADKVLAIYQRYGQ